MACCLSPSCCPGRRSVRRRPKSAGRSSADVGVCLSGKSTAAPTAEASTPRTSAFVPDVVDRLRRRLCQDGGEGGDSADSDAASTRSPCRCCRRCLGEGDQRQATSTEMDPAAVRPAAPTAAPSKTEPTSSSTPNVGDADFMTLFFQNCEKIVLDNAAAIHEMLAVPDNCTDDNFNDEEHQTTDVWTSDPSSFTSPVERRRHLSDSVSPGSDLPAAVTGGDVCCPTENTDDTSPSYERTEGPVETLVAPANSPVSSESLTSSQSEEVQRSAAVMPCICSPSVKSPSVGPDDRLFDRRRPSVSGQSPAAAVSATNWTAADSAGDLRIVSRRHGLWQRTRRSEVVRTSTTDDDDAHIEFVARRKSGTTNRSTLFPVGLGSRPPCLGQECSPIRSTPCGAAPETSSSGATAGAMSLARGLTPRVLPPGRTGYLPASCRRRRRRRRSAPFCRHPHSRDDVVDAPLPAVVRQSCHKVDTWLRHHTPASDIPKPGRDDVTPGSGGCASENQLKRKLICGDLDNSVKRRVTDTDSCSLPSGTFTSDEDDEQDGTRGVCIAAKVPPTANLPRATPAHLRSPLPSPTFTPGPRIPMTLLHRRQRHPVANVGGERNGPPRAAEAEEEVSSGALGDRSSTTRSSLGTSDRRQSPPLSRGSAGVDWRKNGVPRRRRRVTRFARRLHRVAAAEVMSGVHVETLAVL